MIFHAGSSPAGRDQAARFADVVFTAQHTTEGAKAFRTDMRRRAEGHGRHPDSIKILPGMNVILGETLDEAKRKKAALDNALTLDQLLAAMARICGVSPAFLREHLDRPFPVAELPSGRGAQERGRLAPQHHRSRGRRKTSRYASFSTRAPSSHHHIVGTAADVADAMEERLEAQAADGFTMMVDMLPEGIDDIVNLLVPELQRRGLFHKEYSHHYLRDALGLQGPPPSATRQGKRERELS